MPHPVSPFDLGRRSEEALDTVCPGYRNEYRPRILRSDRGNIGRQAAAIGPGSIRGVVAQAGAAFARGAQKLLTRLGVVLTEAFDHLQRPPGSRLSSRKLRVNKPICKAH